MIIIKAVKHIIKLTLKARHATPAPPVGTCLGPSGINIQKFCDDFNKWTKDLEGNVKFGVIIYSDLSYELLSKKEIQEYERVQFLESISFLYKEQDKIEDSKKTR